MPETTIQQLENATLTIRETEISIETPDQFDKSCFRNEYRHIWQTISEIINTNIRQFDRTCQKHSKAITYRPDVRIHNIVPIIGDRGAGKSSIMHSIIGALKGYQKNGEAYPKGFCFPERESDGQRLEFFCLRTIDGSLLEPNEDIFQTILAQMYMELKKEYRDDDPDYRSENIYERQKLSRKFEELYRNIGKLQKMHTHENIAYIEDTSPLSSLEQLSSSLKLREDFERLVKDFLRKKCAYNRGRRFEEQNYYLVVAIDDLDLNIEHGYEMLEEIHRYLMLPNVIVLMAFDQQQFKRLSDQFFYRMVPTFDSRMNLAAADIGELSRQYLNKIMPIDSRTYVPNWTNCSDIRVKMVDKDQDKSQNTHGDGYTQKSLLFQMLQKKLGMRMDTEGEKRHFFEQNSLRTFISFMLMLDNMLPLHQAGKRIEGKGSVAFLRAIEHNYRIMESEILRRMTDERLSDGITGTKQGTGNMGEESYVKAEISYRNLLDQLIDTPKPFHRVFRRLYSHVRKEGEQIRNPMAYELGRIAEALGNRTSIANFNQLSELTGALDYFGYSYGEVMRILYCYGRIDDEHKKLVHCLMAYYSLVMTKSFLEYSIYPIYQPYSGSRKEEIQNIITEQRQSLIDTLNGSVAGSWAGKMMPWVRGKRDDRKFLRSSVRKVVNLKGVFIIDIDSITQSDSQAEIEKFLKSVLVLGMFFDCPGYRQQPSFQWNFEQKESPNSNLIRTEQNNGNFVQNRAFLGRKTRNSQIQNTKGIAVFNFMNFVTNAFEYKEKTFKLLEQTCKCLKDADLHNVEAAQKSIQKEFTKWAAYSGGFALPVYNVDLCYNLLKRLRQRAFSFQNQVVDSSVFLNEYLIGSDELNTKGAYWFLAQKLRNNDKIYEKKSDVTLYSYNDYKRRNYVITSIKFADAFLECPYIKWILNRKEYLSADFDTMFNNIFDNMFELNPDNDSDNDKYKYIYDEVNINSYSFDDKSYASMSYDD